MICTDARVIRGKRLSGRGSGPKKLFMNWNGYPQYPLPKSPRLPYHSNSQAVMAMWEDEDDADYEEEVLAMRHRHDKKKQRKRMEYMMSLGCGNVHY